MNYEERDTYGICKSPPISGPGPELMGADTLNGNDVYNEDGEDLGEKLFAVPWDALKLDTQNKRFVLHVEKDRLKSAPGFDKEHWPNMADTAWADGVNSFYGIKPHPDERRIENRIVRPSPSTPVSHNDRFNDIRSSN